MTNVVLITRNGKQTGNAISRDKNLAYTESLLPLNHIVEAAYKRGIYEFYNGVRIPMNFSKPQSILVHRRAMAIRAGDKRKEEFYTNQLLDQHITLEDQYEVETLMETKGYFTTVASNPYSANTLYALEWQRGFDTGFNRTRIKNLGKV